MKKILSLLFGIFAKSSQVKHPIEKETATGKWIRITKKIQALCKINIAFSSMFCFVSLTPFEKMRVVMEEVGLKNNLYIYCFGYSDMGSAISLVDKNEFMVLSIVSPDIIPPLYFRSISYAYSQYPFNINGIDIESTKAIDRVVEIENSVLRKVMLDFVKIYNKQK